MTMWTKEKVVEDRKIFEELVKETVNKDTVSTYLQNYDKYMKEYIIGQVYENEWGDFFSKSRLMSFFSDKKNNIRWSVLGKILKLHKSEYIAKYDEYVENIRVSRPITEITPKQEYLTKEQCDKIFNAEYEYRANRDENKFLLAQIICELSYSCYFEQKEIAALEVEDVITEIREIKNMNRRDDNQAKERLDISDSLCSKIDDYKHIRSKQKNTSRKLIDESLYKGLTGGYTSYINTCFGPLKTVTGIKLIDCTTIAKSSILHKLEETKGEGMVEIVHVIGFNSNNAFLKDPTMEYLRKENSQNSSPKS